MRRLFFASCIAVACQAPSPSVSRASSQAPSSVEGPAAARPGAGGVGQGAATRSANLEQSAPAPRLSGARRTEVTWNFPKTELGDMSVVVLLPAWARVETPVLVLLHGKGESVKGPERGARGWIDDYQLQRVLDRLAAPPLSLSDFVVPVTAQHLAKVNAMLEARPFREYALVLPYVPDRFGRGELFANALRMASFLQDRVLPRLRFELGLAAEPSLMAIDGVSLGGRVALATGLAAAETFFSVAGTQAAIDESEVEELVGRVRAARTRNPSMRLRLLTSHDDYFLGVNRQLSGLLAREGVRHVFDVVPGDHSYAFNRGPGAIGILTYHAQTLPSSVVKVQP